ncbi:MAG: sensor histidine kinase [Pararhodobacter sp.]
MTGKTVHAQISLDFLSDPALLLNRDGTIVQTNTQARRLLGDGLIGRPLAALLDDTPERLRGIIDAAARSTAPMMSALTLHGPEQGPESGPGQAHGGTRRQVRLARITRDPVADPLIVLLFAGASGARFSKLREDLRQAEALLRERMVEKAELHAALEQNRLLYRELQHRLKNNIHLIGALLRLSARDQDSPEVGVVIDGAMRRIQAMGRTQEAIYEARSLNTLDARPFIERILRGLTHSLMPHGRIDAQLDDVIIQADAAHNLALIVNELATNAMKYGRQDADALLSVALRHDPASDTMILEIADNGPGFDPATVQHSSGLALCEALVSQLDGHMQHCDTSQGGSCWRVHLPGESCIAAPPDLAPTG